jgi:hypothetical protein
VLAQDHPDVARSLNNMADLYERQNRYADAEPLYRRALSIRERAVGLDHPETATSTNNFANLLRLEGRVNDALPLLARLIVTGRAQVRVALPALYEAQRQQLIASGTALDALDALDDALNVIQRGVRCSPISTMLPRRAMPILPSGARSR